MLYREIMAVCSQIHTKHINTAVWAEIKPGGTVRIVAAGLQSANDTDVSPIKQTNSKS
jgi:hypothetical protein